MYGSSSTRLPSISYATQTGICSQPVSTSSLVRKKSVRPLTRVAYRAIDRVEPAAAAVAAGGDAALAADAAQRLAVLVEQLGRERARRRRGSCTP